ncbi:MAG: C39 family peptidase [Anaerolineales bacterium]|jgi:tetratricopeptide (TPR) repeat protein
MRNLSVSKILILGVSLIILALLVYQLPPVKQRLSWRIDFFMTYVRGVIHPAEPLPPPRVVDNPAAAGAAAATYTPPPAATQTPGPTDTPTPGPTATQTPSPTPLPQSVSLPAPAWEKQDINNCGPAALTMHLRYYGWEGDQFDISDLIKPVREDRNVNVEELVQYVRTRAGWLNAEFRVGGTLPLLKQLLAAGIPVTIEESFTFEEPYWPNDDLWAAHYQLLTGYDEASQTFTGQDSYYGPDQHITYEALDANWKIFNRVYILIYPPEQEDQVKAILGPDWDVDANRQRALETAQEEAQANPEDAFAWFNIGSNQVYFGDYSAAAQAYDEARTLGLPQRMLRYQFGPFFAYFHTGRIDELMTVSQYALERTPNSEEALLWRGWGYYRQPEPDINQAVTLWRQALEAHPDYQDALYALEFVGATP